MSNEEAVERAKRSDRLSVLTKERFNDDEFKMFENCLDLLRPLRVFCDRMERSGSTLCRVVPEVRNVVCCYKAMYAKSKRMGAPERDTIHPDCYPIMKHLVSRFVARMAVNIPDICITAYLLTREGRDELIKEMQPGNLPVQVAGTETGARVTSMTDTELITARRRDGYEELSDDEDCEEELDDEWVNGLPESPDDDPAFDGVTYKDLQADLFGSGDIEQMLDHRIYRDLFDKAANSVKRMALAVGLQEDKSEICVSCLYRWVSSPDCEIPFMRMLRAFDTPDGIWRQALMFDDWNMFAQIALRFVTLGTSEAGVERLISAHRDIASLKGTRFHADTIRDRLQLRLHRNKE
jgi:hypothetical protein